MSSPLQSLKHLSSQPAEAEEFVRLKAAGAKWLRDSSSASKALENRFHFAYNAAVSFSRAALRYHGLRSDNIDLVFCVAPHALGLDADISRRLLRCREVHEGWGFQGRGQVDQRTFDALIAACAAIAAKVETLPPLD
jgi:hypothetical protein